MSHTNDENHNGFKYLTSDNEIKKGMEQSLHQSEGKKILYIYMQIINYVSE